MSTESGITLSYSIVDNTLILTPSESIQLVDVDSSIYDRLGITLSN